MPLLLNKLCKQYYDDDTDSTIDVLLDIDLSIEKGSFVSVIGPSGCGKTTLLRIIAGLESSTSGEVYIHNQKPKEPWRHVGFVFQEYALFPWRTVCKNIEFALEMKNISAKERRQKAIDYIRRFGLEGFENNFPNELSGGMKQRVALARTLIDESDIILMDEPFGALDSQTRLQMQQFLLKVWHDIGKTILFVTHNIDEAVMLSRKVIGLTRRPGRASFARDVDLPYPRDVTSDAFNEYRKDILTFLNEQHSFLPER